MSEHFRSTRPLPILYCMVHPCALGHALLSASEKGVSAVFFGDNPKNLLFTLQQRYPMVQLQEGGAVLERWGSTVLNIIAHPKLQHVVPLDALSGTDFQRQVWKALRGIPAGQTRTYTQVAQSIERPLAVRAVANACAANPIAVLIPCHRVVRSDGQLGGYHWGIERKRQLLLQEQEMLQG